MQKIIFLVISDICSFYLLFQFMSGMAATPHIYITARDHDMQNLGIWASNIQTDSCQNVRCCRCLHSPVQE